MDFDALTPNQKLDEILKFLNGKPYQPIHAICYNFYSKDPKIVAEKLPELYQILGFLESEQFVTDSGTDYRLTFPGQQFIEDGGYIGRHDRTTIEKNRAVTNELMLRWGAVGAAVGAIALFALELLKFLIDYNVFCF
jgi:hypothetical protein